MSTIVQASDAAPVAASVGVISATLSAPVQGNYLFAKVSGLVPNIQPVLSDNAAHLLPGFDYSWYLLNVPAEPSAYKNNSFFSKTWFRRAPDSNAGAAILVSAHVDTGSTQSAAAATLFALTVMEVSLSAAEIADFKNVVQGII